MNNVITVYGATGFIGRELVNFLGDRALTVDRAVIDVFTPIGDVVYLISTTDNYNIFTDVHRDIDVNLTLLVDVLENVRESFRDNKLKTFNYISTWFVYGPRMLIPAREDDNCNPAGFYSITKYAAELLVSSYCNTHKIPYRIIRPSNVYGSGDTSAGIKKNFLCSLPKNILKGSKISLYDNGMPVRDLIHVSDAARGIIHIVDNANTRSIYNLGTGIGTSLNDVVKLYEEFLETKAIVEYIDAPQFHKNIQSTDCILDVTELIRIGFTHQMNLRDGLRSLCEYERNANK